MPLPPPEGPACRVGSGQPEHRATTALTLCRQSIASTLFFAIGHEYLGSSDGRAPGWGAMTALATLVPRWTGGHYGYLYDVTFDGETIVSGSHSPGHDACRALFSRGKTGKLTLVSVTGVSRMSFDILRSALLIVSEEDLKGLRLRRHKKASAKGDSPVREAEVGRAEGRTAGSRIAAHARALRHWERDDDYPHVVLRLGDDWRIVGCRDDVQWILQRRSGSAWRSSGYCHTRPGLQAVLRRNSLDLAAVDAFPDRYPEGGRAASAPPLAPEAPLLAPEDEEIA
jgi:hypothetical protein